jgi:hypothetical protein
MSTFLSLLREAQQYVFQSIIGRMGTPSVCYPVSSNLLKIRLLLLSQKKTVIFRLENVYSNHSPPQENSFTRASENYAK